MTKLALLGPQSHLPNVAQSLTDLGLKGPFCAMTAGWQERADEIAALESHLRVPVSRLDLYRRADAVFERDTEFFQAYRSRQNQLRERQRVYRIRLNLVMKQCLEVWQLPHEYSAREEERVHAMGMVRELDRHHLAAVDAIQKAFDEQWQPLNRHEVSRHREEIRRILASSEAVLIAGGHVAVLLNRLRLFGIKALLADLPIVAWAGGTMVLGQELVLFHDKPPQGPGFSEVLERGLGIYRNQLVFPDSSLRLDLKDRHRLQILARRFQPQQCLLLDPGSRALRRGGKWRFECNRIDLEGNLLDANTPRST